jgi:hypothetical protein
MSPTQHSLSHVGINRSVANFIDFVILFSNIFLSKNGVVFHFHADDLHVLKEIRSFLDNYFLRIQMKWIVINSVEETSSEDHLTKVFNFLRAHFFFPSFLCTPIW